MINSTPCHSCGKTGLELILSLGAMPLANSLLTPEQVKQPEEIFPLDLAFCPHCTLVQITETVPPEKLFREYLYFSSYSETLLQHARQLARQLIHLRKLNADSLVVELASNDGYQLQYFMSEGIPVLGVEPAVNIARVAQEERGIPTVNEFFNAELAQRLLEGGKQADVIIANNVVAHVADLNGFVKGIQILLKDDGMAVLEMSYLRDMIDSCGFDLIYHEHLYYYSLTAFSALCQRHGLIVQDVERVGTQGGSLRIFVTRAGSQSPTDRVAALLEEEAAWVSSMEYYGAFARRVEGLKEELRRLLHRLKSEGKQIVGYGAAAKTTVLLNYFSIGEDFLDYVVDLSPHKQQRYVPGVHLPIHAPSQLLEDMPDYVLIFVWNIANEILEQQAEYRRRGGQFIIPIPEIRIV